MCIPQILSDCLINDLEKLERIIIIIVSTQLSVKFVLAPLIISQHFLTNIFSMFFYCVKEYIIYNNRGNFVRFSFFFFVDLAQLLFTGRGHPWTQTHTDLCAPSHHSWRRINIRLQVSL